MLASVFTRDINKALNYAKLLEAGVCHSAHSYLGGTRLIIDV